MRTYWLWWFTATFPLGFLIPETIALIRGRTADTLSGAIWQLEKLQPGQGITHWTAFHLLFTGTFTLLTIWLIFHFGFGIWR